MLGIILASAEGAGSSPLAALLDPATMAGIGGLIVGVVAGIYGLRKGGEDKHLSPIDPGFSVIGSSLVDSLTLRRLCEAVESLTEALLAGIEADERQSKDDTGRRLDELARQIEEKIPAPRHPRSPRHPEGI